MQTPILRTTPSLAGDGLLSALNAQTPLVERHLALLALFDWIRGDEDDAVICVTRIENLLDVLESQPERMLQLRAWWRTILTTVDGSTLLADFGFASRNAFVSELIQRLNHKLLPNSPETSDASELFALALPTTLDAEWIAALPEKTLARLATLLTAPAHGHHAQQTPALNYWQCTLLDALTFCTAQVRAAGFSPEIRLRMSTPEQHASPFYDLSASFDAVRNAWLSGVHVDGAAQRFKAQLEACRHCAATVYTHLDTHGISVDLVFRLRQLRERVLRIRVLLDCLLDDADHKYAARLLSQLVVVGQDRSSIGALISSSSSLLAAKVAERSSETGEHYITRSRAEYRAMLGNAAGGGVLTAFTVALKFALTALGLAAFWFGFWSGLMYAASFVLIQLLHFTLATKQPAMTAPAMAAKLKDLGDPTAVDGFVDEVSHLVRSQVAAVLGNVVAVFPVAVLLSVVWQAITGAPMIDADKAHGVLQSLTLLGPCLLFAAFTGVLLFASSIIAGWVENWFVLHRLDSALRYNPRFTRLLGAARADRWAFFMRHNISGFASNISLGFMLGLVPAILAFLGIGLDVRHVTLSTGQLAAACASLGWDAAHLPAVWWAVASIPFIGALNLGVSFYLAFRVALQAHNVTGIGRASIRRAIWQRLRTQPMSFFWPTREQA
ncbi:MAG: site-specific recombinase [Rhodoferax sp.]|nr:site-specific recombinase [Rhodoferax sp.]